MQSSWIPGFLEASSGGKEVHKQSQVPKNYQNTFNEPFEWAGGSDSEINKPIGTAPNQCSTTYILGVAGGRDGNGREWKGTTCRFLWAYGVSCCNCTTTHDPMHINISQCGDISEIFLWPPCGTRFLLGRAKNTRKRARDVSVERSYLCIIHFICSHHHHTNWK